MKPADATPRKLPQQQRSRLLVDTILQAAARVFESHGYAHATTNRIAEVAQVSIGSVYQYFPNKDAILVALMERHVAEGTELVGPLLAGLDPAEPVGDALARVTRAMVELHRQAPALHRVLVEESPRPAELRARLDALFDAAVLQVERYLAAHPTVTVPDVHVAARLVVQVIEAVTHQLVIHGSESHADITTTETIRMLTTYLTATPAPVAAR